MIMINGRIHKASFKEFVRTETSQAQPEPVSKPMTNYVAYTSNDKTGKSRIGHLDTENSTITPLSFASGTAIENLYQVIEVGKEGIIAGGEPFPLSDR